MASYQAAGQGDKAVATAKELLGKVPGDFSANFTIASLTPFLGKTDAGTFGDGVKASKDLLSTGIAKQFAAANKPSPGYAAGMGRRQEAGAGFRAPNSRVGGDAAQGQQRRRRRTKTDVDARRNARPSCLLARPGIVGPSRPRQETRRRCSRSRVPPPMTVPARYRPRAVSKSATISSSSTLSSPAVKRVSPSCWPRPRRAPPAGWFRRDQGRGDPPSGRRSGLQQEFPAALSVRKTERESTERGRRRHLGRSQREAHSQVPSFRRHRTPARAPNKLTLTSTEGGAAEVTLNLENRMRAAPGRGRPLLSKASP